MALRRSARRWSVRDQLIATARAMSEAGLNRGTAGNVSARDVNGGTAGFWITPTGLPYEQLEPDCIPFMHLDGSWEGHRAPSSEWRLHRDIYAARPEAGAVLHAHSPHAVSLACVRCDIPPFHYMIARFGGDSVRCAPYATFGTQELSDAALAAMQDRSACLLANHGFLLHGSDLGQALILAIELEELCAQYWRACLLRQPALLDAEEMAAVLEKFKDYGQPRDRSHRGS
ncbi:MAG: class II aldolase/adducin family protein [Frankiaceae bacterium]